MKFKKKLIIVSACSNMSPSKTYFHEVFSALTKLAAMNCQLVQVGRNTWKIVENGRTICDVRLCKPFVRTLATYLELKFCMEYFNSYEYGETDLRKAYDQRKESFSFSNPDKSTNIKVSLSREDDKLVACCFDKNQLRVMALILGIHPGQGYTVFNEDKPAEKLANIIGVNLLED